MQGAVRSLSRALSFHRATIALILFIFCTKQWDYPNINYLCEGFIFIIEIDSLGLWSFRITVRQFVKKNISCFDRNFRLSLRLYYGERGEIKLFSNHNLQKQSNRRHENWRAKKAKWKSLKLPKDVQMYSRSAAKFHQQKIWISI